MLNLTLGVEPSKQIAGPSPEQTGGGKYFDIFVFLPCWLVVHINREEQQKVQIKARIGGSD